MPWEMGLSDQFLPIKKNWAYALESHVTRNDFKPIVYGHKKQKKCIHDHVFKGKCLYCGKKDIKI